MSRWRELGKARAGGIDVLLFLKFHRRVFFTSAYRPRGLYRIARLFQSRSQVTAIPRRFPVAAGERSFALYSSHRSRSLIYERAVRKATECNSGAQVCYRRYNNRLYALLFVRGFMHIIWAPGRRRSLSRRRCGDALYVGKCSYTIFIVFRWLLYE